MKKIVPILLLLSFTALSVQVAAQMSDEEKDLYASELEKNPRIKGFATKIEKGELDPEKLKILYLILSNTSEHLIHCMRGATENSVFLHIDGHKEAVYDGEGKLVQDDINDGSYNYYHPVQEPLLHFAFDIVPWIFFGQSTTDPTSTGERIYAYMGDLEAGIVRAVHDKAKRDELDDIKLIGTGKTQTLAMFSASIEAGGAEQLFELFERDTRPTDKELISVLTKLFDGFLKVCGVQAP